MSAPEDPLLYPQEAQVRAGRVERGKPYEELVHAAAERPEVRLAALGRGVEREGESNGQSVVHPIGAIVIQ